MELIELTDYPVDKLEQLIKDTGQWDDFLTHDVFKQVILDGLVFEVVLDDVGVIGYYLLYNYQPHISIEESLYIYPSFHGRWITRGGLKQIRDLTTKVAFDVLNVERIVGYVPENNTRSRKLTELMGLTQEGVLRKTKKMNGELTDVVVYSMLKEER